MRSRHEPELRDAYVEIRYEGKPVSVRVIFSHGSGSLNVQLIDETSDLLRKHRTVDLETLVEFRSAGEIKPIMSPITEDISFAEMCRRADARAKLVDRDLEKTVAALGTKLRQHGADILQGETQVFNQYRESKKKRISVDQGSK
jgi:hypothetical protein